MIGLDTRGDPLPKREATYTPVYFSGGKCVRGEGQPTAEAARQVLTAWKTHYNLEHPTAVEVTVKVVGSNHKDRSE
jgi:hypothetical protein